MKNPLSHTLTCWRWWRQLQSTGFFSWQDATLQIDRVILPARFAYQAAGKALQQQARITEVDAKTHRIDLPEHELHFYWRGPIDNNIYFLIEQEYLETNPHCYTTPPIQLKPTSQVVDVGACEGLFAYRLIKEKRCQRVICFEPLPSMADLLERGAKENGSAAQITVEALAVGEVSGPVKLMASDNPDACRVVPWDESEGEPDAHSVRLDEYLQEKEITLSADDLIKVDAEGTDLAVIEGAADTIAKHRPQVAVTTYHDDTHVQAISSRLKELNPDYVFRLKGFSHWTNRPRPVLLQAGHRAD